MRHKSYFLIQSSRHTSSRKQFFHLCTFSTIYSSSLLPIHIDKCLTTLSLPRSHKSHMRLRIDTLIGEFPLSYQRRCLILFFFIVQVGHRSFPGKQFSLSLPYHVLIRPIFWFQQFFKDREWIILSLYKKILIFQSFIFEYII